MIEWISTKESLPTANGSYLVCYSYSDFSEHKYYDVYSFSLNLNSVDKYDFPKGKYKNKKGFYQYDDEYGFCEQKDVLYWAYINPPIEKGDNNG